MNITKRLRISGTGKYLPRQIISSEELEISLGLPPGWSNRFSGVRERRRAEGESNADMAVGALQMALTNSGNELRDIDLLISASVTFDYILPFEAALILKKIRSDENLNIQTMDVNSSCLSFVTAFEVAANMMDGAKFKKIAIVSSEISSIGLNPGNKEVYTLFGDGAAAAILEYDTQYRGGLVKSMFRTYPEGYYGSMIKGGGNAYPARNNPYDPVLYSFNMEGKKLLKLARQKIPAYFTEFFSDLDVGMGDIDLIIPHQASKAGNAVFSNLYPETEGKIFSNLETHGNCIAASIPLCLHDAIESGKLTRGQTCLLAGTAAGFAIGSILLIY